MPDISREDVRVEPGSRQKVGVDVFVETADSPQQLGERLERIISGTPYRLKMISNRGTVVWPSTGGSASCVDHFRCRFVIDDRSCWSADSILDLLGRIGRTYRWMHVEKPEELDGAPAYTRAQVEN